MSHLNQTQFRNSHTHLHPAKKKSHPPTPSQENVTLTYTYSHPAKKMIPTHTHPHPTRKNVTPTHTQSRKGRKHLHPPTPAPKVVTSSQKRSHPPTNKWKKEHHVSHTWYMREKYSVLTILAGVFICGKDWPVNFYLLNTFERAFESIVCLFVFNN